MVPASMSLPTLYESLLCTVSVGVFIRANGHAAMFTSLPVDFHPRFSVDGRVQFLVHLTGVLLSLMASPSILRSRYQMFSES